MDHSLVTWFFSLSLKHMRWAHQRIITHILVSVCVWLYLIYRFESDNTELYDSWQFNSRYFFYTHNSKYEYRKNVWCYLKCSILSSSIRCKQIYSSRIYKLYSHVDGDICYLHDNPLNFIWMTNYYEIVWSKFHLFGPWSVLFVRKYSRCVWKSRK